MLLSDSPDPLLLKKGKCRQAPGGLEMQITGDCDSSWPVCPHPRGMLSDATYDSELTLTTRFVLDGRGE